MLISAKQLARTIVKDIRGDGLLHRVSNFSELHNYCDANMLGITNDVCDQYTNFSDAIDIINKAQNIVNRYIRKMS